MFTRIRSMGKQERIIVIVPIVTILLMPFSISSSFAMPPSNAIGIYFDNDFLINCTPDSMSFPFISQAYIVLKDISLGNSILGWEAQLHHTGNIIINLSDISGNELNMGIFPEFIVGLNAPLSGESAILLATLNIIAFSPGSIYIGPPAFPSIPNAEAPLYAAAPGNLIQMCYSYGSINEPVATIGMMDCPIPNEDEEEGFNEGPLRIILDPSITSPLYITDTSITGNKSEDGFDTTKFCAVNIGSDVSFVGDVIDVEYQCVQEPTGARAGIAIVRMLVAESYWGVENGAVVSISVDGYNIDNCVEYLAFVPRPGRDELVAGAQYLVNALANTNGYEAMRYGFIGIDSMASINGFSNLNIQDLLLEMSWVESHISFTEQAETAKLIVEGELVNCSSGICEIKVSRVIRGIGIGDNIKISLSNNEFKQRYQMTSAIAPKLEFGNRYLLFLSENYDYYLTYGKHSIFRLIDGGYTGISDGRTYSCRF